MRAELNGAPKSRAMSAALRKNKVVVKEQAQTTINPALRKSSALRKETPRAESPVARKSSATRKLIPARIPPKPKKAPMPSILTPAKPSASASSSRAALNAIEKLGRSIGSNSQVAEKELEDGLERASSLISLLVMMKKRK